MSAQRITPARTLSMDYLAHCPNTPHARWWRTAFTSGDYAQQFKVGDRVVVRETGETVHVHAVYLVLNTDKYWYQTGDMCHRAGALKDAQDSAETPTEEEAK